MLSNADYQNTSHTSSLQLPTYPIFYYAQCEEGDELVARLAEDGTHYLLLEAERTMLRMAYAQPSWMYDVVQLQIAEPEKNEVRYVRSDSA